MIRCLFCLKLINNKKKPYKHEHGYLCSQKCVNKYCGISRQFIK